jgi:hypothetical protein
MNEIDRGTAEEQSRPRPRVEYAHLARHISLAPAPGRMLNVSVHADGEGGREVRWERVIGMLCLVETEYLKKVPAGGDSPSPGATHEDMIDRGWKGVHPSNWFPEVWPVVAGGNASDEPSIRVLNSRWDDDSIYSMILVCDWPPEEDRDRAIAAGLELARHGNAPNWAKLPGPSEGEAAR